MNNNMCGYLGGRWSDEHYPTKKQIVNAILQKIDSLDRHDGMKNIFKRELINYPVEIEQNILEWILGEPLTDIDCHGESIVNVLAVWNLTEEEIPDIILGFINFKKTDYTMPNYVWQNISKIGANI